MITLKVESTDPSLQEHFCQYLIHLISVKVIAKISNQKDFPLQIRLRQFNDYLNSDMFPRKKDIYGLKHLNVIDILVQGALNLRYLKNDGNYLICIDKNQLIPGTFIKIVDICKLVDYGNLGLKGLKIFDSIMREVEENIEDYIRDYKS